ncbi:MAG: tyrosine-protein phosphatase [Sphingomonadaceae bacterium]|nr:tyrosine-protein phosphatase [Sphingomonadaceae bacterium]
MLEPLTSLNFRDLSGLPAAGGRVRPGTLYRSEGPRNFSAEQLAELRSLNIRAIIDLRSSQERAEAPHEWHNDHCHWLGLDVEADLRVFGFEGRERLSKGPEPEIAIETMRETYRFIPRSLLNHWRAIAETLLDERVPALVNCTAGKDRTGVAVALLLELAGVSREVILLDYLASSIFGDNMFRAGTIEPGFMGSYGFLPSPGQIDALVGVRPDYLEAAWDEVDQVHGGSVRYFEQAGLDAKVQAALRTILVE